MHVLSGSLYDNIKNNCITGCLIAFGSAKRFRRCFPFQTDGHCEKLQSCCWLRFPGQLWIDRRSLLERIGSGHCLTVLRTSKQFRELRISVQWGILVVFSFKILTESLLIFCSCDWVFTSDDPSVLIDLSRNAMQISTKPTTRTIRQRRTSTKEKLSRKLFRLCHESDYICTFCQFFEWFFSGRSNPKSLTEN